MRKAQIFEITSKCKLRDKTHFAVGNQMQFPGKDFFIAGGGKETQKRGAALLITENTNEGGAKRLYWGLNGSREQQSAKVPATGVCLLPVRQTETEVAHAAEAEKRVKHFSRTYAPNHHHHHRHQHNAVEKHLETELWQARRQSPPDRTNCRAQERK